MSSSSATPEHPAASTGVGQPAEGALRAVLEGTDDAVHLYDEAWRWVYLNPAGADWVRALGHEPESLLGRVVWDVFDLGPSVRELAERAVREGRETVTELPIPGREHRWFETRIVPVRGGVATFSRDVTPRRRAEKRQRILAEASAMLSTSLEADATLEALARLAADRMADYALTYVLDEPSRVLRRVGASAARDEETLRRLIGQSIPLESEHAVAVAVRTGESTLTTSISDDDLQQAARDEEQLEILRRMAPASSIIVPLRARGRTLGAFATATVVGGSRPYEARDLALAEELALRAALAYDNARLLEQAQAGSRAKSQFLATVSHELRTPLTAILGYADLMDAGLSGPLTDPQRTQIRRIMMSSRHLVGVIDQILTFSRADAGREEVRLEDVDLDELLDETVALLDPLAFEKGLKLERRGDAVGRALHSDAGKLRQILVNLAGNAVKFTDRGHVTLEVEDGGDDLVVRVVDTGPGIEASQVERIFEPFTQVHETDTRLHGGAGLGLAVSRRLARLLGGDVTVESTPGEGSSFTLRIPSGPRSPTPP